ncbi:hypothetical protein DdX_02013 [Ditylenchus destructor]|uniref:Uncharacterized protein n=1 Tax=Ditylenchus destructor TaxID=166010 RepID=A0AAD4RBW0_9BILA|nr:hypothetical protein DdX_02013 [Ditylenchus destructor]
MVYTSFMQAKIVFAAILQIALFTIQRSLRDFLLSHEVKEREYLIAEDSRLDALRRRLISPYPCYSCLTRDGSVPYQTAMVTYKFDELVGEMSG